MLCDNIRNIRISKNVGLNELARKINISPGYLSEIERGLKTNVGFDILSDIAAALDISIAILLEGDTQAQETFLNEINGVSIPYTAKSDSVQLVSELDKQLIRNRKIIKETVSQHTNIRASYDNCISLIENFFADRSTSKKDKEALFKYVSDLYWKSKEKNI